MFEYRVTKYDPAHRDPRGAYTKDEWTSVDDIGRSFGGVTLTCDEYERIEDAYVAAAVAFLSEGNIPSLVITGLENHGDPLPFGDGSVLTLEEIAHVVRQVLREEFWCRLEGLSGFLHLGYDYYMYLGVSSLCPAARALAESLGLFVEEFRSPYRQRFDVEPVATPDEPCA